MNGGRMPDTDALAINSAPPEPSPAEVEAYADYVGEIVGDWNVYPSAPHIEGGCFATRMNDEGLAFLLHQERPQGSVSFGVGAEWFNLSNGWKGQTALVIDNQSFPFPNIRALDKATLFSAETSDPVALVNALRRGQTAEFSYLGKTYGSDLDGFATMVPAFAKCVAANDKTYASVQSGNHVNRALGVTLPADNGSTRSAEANDVEDEDGPATGSSMGALLDRPRAYAQLRCSIPVIHLVGLHGALAQPFEFDISVNGDATAIVQGTKITPVEHTTATGSPGPSIAIYQASEIFGAANKSPLVGMVANAPRPPQGEFEEGFFGMLANPGSMVPENRLLGVSLTNNDVTVADQLPGGGFGDMTSHRCRRIR